VNYPFAGQDTCCTVQYNRHEAIDLVVFQVSSQVLKVANEQCYNPINDETIAYSVEGDIY
jgi:uncharacterized protein (UPF0297 family)